MHYLFNSLFTENKNTDNVNVSVEKPIENNKTINASKSPGINDYKYNAKIKKYF